MLTCRYSVHFVTENTFWNAYLSRYRLWHEISTSLLYSRTTSLPQDHDYRWKLLNSFSLNGEIEKYKCCHICGLLYILVTWVRIAWGFIKWRLWRKHRLRLSRQTILYSSISRYVSQETSLTKYKTSECVNKTNSLSMKVIVNAFTVKVMFTMQFTSHANI